MFSTRLILLLLLLSFYRSPAQTYVPRAYDLIITEIMADPSPPVLLPNAEFLELKNQSGISLNLSGWKISTASSTSGSFPVFVLQPDSFLIITSTSNVSLFSVYGPSLGIPSFPALPNSGGTISI